MHLGAVRGINALIAVDAPEVAKLNTRTQPSFLQSLHQAVHVSYVSTLDHDTWCYIQSFRIANRAVVIPSFASCGIRILLNAIWVKAGKTFELASETTAIVAASEDFLTGIVHQVDAVSGATHFLEGRHHRW